MTKDSLRKLVDEHDQKRAIPLSRVLPPRRAVKQRACVQCGAPSYERGDGPCRDCGGTVAEVTTA